MNYLADTNVAARWALPTYALYTMAREARVSLEEQGHTVYITAQVLIEFRALATRPAESNGLGMTPARGSRGLFMFTPLRNAENEIPDAPD